MTLSLLSALQVSNKKPLNEFSGFSFHLRIIIYHGYVYVRFQSSNAYGYELILE